LHIPLQSGDNGVLNAMSRNYTREFFRERLLKIKEHVGDLAIGTDIIAGFPTETEKSFQNTVELVTELPFTYLHVFPYSARPGTMAAELPGIVGNEEREKRATILRTVSADKKSSYMAAQLGKVLQVLMEECRGGETCTGTSDNYLKVSSQTSAAAIGNIVQIRIERAYSDKLHGKPIETS